MDVVITVHGLDLDGTNRWTNMRLYAGGKGVDVSRAIHEMGGRTIAFGFIGGAAGRQRRLRRGPRRLPWRHPGRPSPPRCRLRGVRTP